MLHVCECTKKYVFSGGGAMAFILHSPFLLSLSIWEHVDRARGIVRMRRYVHDFSYLHPLFQIWHPVALQMLLDYTCRYIWPLAMLASTDGSWGPSTFGDPQVPNLCSIHPCALDWTEHFMMPRSPSQCVACKYNEKPPPFIIRSWLGSIAGVWSRACLH